MNIPRPPERYEQRWASDLKRELDIESNQTHKKDRDIEVGDGRVIVRSPNGSRWALTVSDAGVVGATAL